MWTSGKTKQVLLFLLTFLFHFLPPAPALSGDAGTAVMWTELKLCTDPKEEFLQLKVGWWRWIPGGGEREQKSFWHVQSKGKMLKPHSLIRASKCLIFSQMCPFSLPLESHLGWCQEAAQCQLCESLATQGGLCCLDRGVRKEGWRSRNRKSISKEWGLRFLSKMLMWVCGRSVQQSQLY